MGERPKSITVIAWILIVAGTISVFTSLSSLNNLMVKEIMSKSPLPVSLQYAMMYIGLAIMVVSGIGMLKGQGWARLLYVVWGAIGFLVGLLTSPMKVAMIPGLIVFAIVVFFLYRPASNQYFTKA
ncbi:MAG: hypothetical protein ABIH18_02630 [Candidatus Omnitrophota bacterium]